MFAAIPGTFGHLSALSMMPPLLVSGSGQPLLLAGPFTFGQLSTESKRPSLSLSFSTGFGGFGGQPLLLATPATLGQRSTLSFIPSPSVSGIISGFTSSIISGSSDSPPKLIAKPTGVLKMFCQIIFKRVLVS